MLNFLVIGRASVFIFLRFFAPPVRIGDCRIFPYMSVRPMGRALGPEPPRRSSSSADGSPHRSSAEYIPDPPHRRRPQHDADQQAAPVTSEADLPRVDAPLGALIRETTQPPDPNVYLAGNCTSVGFQYTW